jgi:hypothetical protein
VTTTPGGRKRLEQANPELVVARDQAIVDKKKEQLQRTLQTQPLAVYRGQRLQI